VRDNIRELFGAAIARDLIPINLEVGPQDAIKANQPPVNGMAFKLTGFISGPTASPKKSSFVLFINDRLVQMGALKKFLESQYATVASKSTSFMYLSLQIHPTKVDVNMHPNKMEVGIIDQQAIISRIGEYFVAEIDQVNVQQGFKASQGSVIDETVPAPKMTTNTSFVSTASVAATMVRNDAKDGSMNSYLGPRRSISPSFSASRFGEFTDEPLASSTPNQSHSTMDMDIDVLVELKKPAVQGKDRISPPLPGGPGSSVSPVLLDEPNDQVQGEANPKKRGRESMVQPATERSIVARAPLKPAERKTRLFASVQELLDELKQKSEPRLEKVLKEWTFVGCLSSKKTLIQVGNQLIMLDISVLSKELLYQECLHQIREPRVLQLEEPVPIEKMVLLALEASTELRDRDVMNLNVVAASAVQRLVQQREMLQEYFGIVITESGDIIGLPEIIEHYVPINLLGLPLFCYNLYARVSYEDERDTLDQIARELASLLAIPSEEEPEALAQEHGKPPLLVSKEVAWMVQAQILPALRRRFFAPQTLQQLHAIVLVVSTDKLFKIFERC
jgi:DNA mismatch repair protein MLH1